MELSKKSLCINQLYMEFSRLKTSSTYSHRFDKQSLQDARASLYVRQENNK